MVLSGTLMRRYVPALAIAHDDKPMHVTYRRIYDHAIKLNGSMLITLSGQCGNQHPDW